MARKRGKPKDEYGKKRFGVRGLGQPNAQGKSRQLTYFYTVAQWEAARNSPGFQRWARTQRPPPPERVRVRIEARPVMHLAQEKVNVKVPRLWDVAEQQSMKPAGGRKGFAAQ